MAAKKKKKKYRGFWIFVKVQFVLSLLVLGGLGYYVLGGYASEVSSIHKEADSLVPVSYTHLTLPTTSRV